MSNYISFAAYLSVSGSTNNRISNLAKKTNFNLPKIETAYFAGLVYNGQSISAIFAINGQPYSVEFESVNKNGQILKTAKLVSISKFTLAENSVFCPAEILNKIASADQKQMFQLTANNGHAKIGWYPLLPDNSYDFESGLIKELDLTKYSFEFSGFYFDQETIYASRSFRYLQRNPEPFKNSRGSIAFGYNPATGQLNNKYNFHVSCN